MSTYNTNDGAVIGRHRVRVGWSAGGVDPSCSCVVNSERDIMEFEVRKDENNEVEVVLLKKDASYRPSLEELEAAQEAEDDQG